jgi:hypothetical protein
MTAVTTPEAPVLHEELRRGKRPGADKPRGVVPTVDGRDPIDHSGAMTARSRLIVAGVVVATLVAMGFGYALDLAPVRQITVPLFLFVEVGLVPMLVLAPMRPTRFAAYASAASLTITLGLGYVMALTHVWAPIPMLVAVVLGSLWVLGRVVTRDVAALRDTRQRAARVAAWTGTAAPTPHPVRRPSVLVPAGSLLGVALTAVAAIVNQGDPEPSGLLGKLGVPFWIGLAVLVATTVVALVTRRSLALPVLSLSAIVVFGQAIAYGEPAVMSAARHIGVVDYIRVHGGTYPWTDIYQTWSGLFAGTAWVADAAGIGNAMIIATWFPVLTTVGTTLAIAVLAGRWLSGTVRPWVAAGVATLAGSLNINYYSPQAVGFLMGFAVLAIATERSDFARGALGEIRLNKLRMSGRTADALAWHTRWNGPGRIAAILLITIVMTVTHQISPYLTTAALVALVVFRMVRPWWTPILVGAPAILFALANQDVLGKFVSISAIGRIFQNVQPPTHSAATLPQPLVTRLAFDVPAAALVVIGLLALVVWARYRSRATLGLLAAAASPITLLAATNYGQEGIFRVVLFSTPWLAILAVGAPWTLQRFPRLRVAAVPLFAAALAILTFVNVFGQTALDWNRVMTRSESAATQKFERTAPTGSLLLLTGTSNAVPASTTANYFDVGYLSRESLGAYPNPYKSYDAQQDVSDFTRKLLRNWAAKDYYALVAAPIGAYDQRYGFQSYANYEKLAAAMADSPYWKPVYHDGTTTMYVITKAGIAHAR